MERSARPVSFWVRPVLVGLIVVEGLVGAGATVAASAPTSPRVADVPTVAGTGEREVVSAPSSAYDESAIRGRTWFGPWRASPRAMRPPGISRPRTQPVPGKARVITTKTSATTKPRTTGYHGVYRLWIPALGLSRSISDWGCRGGTIPNRVESWGCAGTNNLYLLGHAWGVFAPIHDGYHSGALRPGLTAWFADKSGDVHRYEVSWVRHVALDDYASWSTWAIAASSRPVITLQTCDGATSAYRILVRLVPV